MIQKFEGFKALDASEFTPQIQKIVESLDDLIKKYVELDEQKKKTTDDDSSESKNGSKKKDTLKGQIASLKEQMKQYKKSMREVQKLARQKYNYVYDSVDDSSDDLKEVKTKDQLAIAKEKWKQQKDRIKTISSIAEQMNSYASQNKGVKNYQGHLSNVSAQVDELNKKLLAGEIPLKEYRTQANALLKTLTTKAWEKADGVIRTTKSDDIEAAKKSMTNLAKEAAGTKNFAGEWSKDFTELTYTIKNANGQLEKYKLTYDSFTGNISRSFSGMVDPKIEKEVSEVEQLINKYKELHQLKLASYGNNKKLTNLISGLENSKTKEEFNAAKQSIDDYLKILDKVKQNDDELKSLGVLSEGVTNFPDAYKKASDALKEYNSQLENGQITLKDYNKVVSDLFKGLDPKKWANAGNVIGITNIDDKSSAQKRMQDYVNSIRNAKNVTTEWTKEGTVLN